MGVTWVVSKVKVFNLKTVNLASCTSSKVNFWLFPSFSLKMRESAMSFLIENNYYCFKQQLSSCKQKLFSKEHFSLRLNESKAFWNHEMLYCKISSTSAPHLPPPPPLCPIPPSLHPAPSTSWSVLLIFSQMTLGDYVYRWNNNLFSQKLHEKRASLLHSRGKQLSLILGDWFFTEEK